MGLIKRTEVENQQDEPGIKVHSYLGQWSEGLPHGRGQVEFSETVTVVKDPGSSSDSVKNLKTTTATYVGEIDRNRFMIGRGVLIRNQKPESVQDNDSELVCQSVYMGQFSQTGLQHGFGAEVWSETKPKPMLSDNQGTSSSTSESTSTSIISTNTYEGSFIHGQKQGVGKCTWEERKTSNTTNDTDINVKGSSTTSSTSVSLSIYEGTWENSLMSGAGVYKSKTETKCADYHGEWRNGKMHGRGVYRWRNPKDSESGLTNPTIANSDSDSTRIYSGSYVNGKREGFGIYRWPVASSPVTVERSSVYESAMNDQNQVSDSQAVKTKCYQGYWSNGLQEGAARVTVSDENGNEVFADSVWVAGKRVLGGKPPPLRLMMTAATNFSPAVMTSQDPTGAVPPVTQTITGLPINPVDLNKSKSSHQTSVTLSVSQSEVLSSPDDTMSMRPELAGFLLRDVNTEPVMTQNENHSEKLDVNAIPSLTKSFQETLTFDDNRLNTDTKTSNANRINTDAKQTPKTLSHYIVAS